MLWLTGLLTAVPTECSRLERAQTEGRLADMLRDRETENVVVDFIASENRLARFVAARVYRLLLTRLSRSRGASSGAGRQTNR